LERRELFKSGVYTNTVKSLANVKLCKDLGVGDLGERFVD
jgi:hypothetical protein